MIRLAIASLTISLFVACGAPVRQMELRSSEQTQIAQILGCNDYNIDESDAPHDGSPSRTYQAACTDGSASASFVCTDGQGCQRQ